jgi:LEA14-like dessication related protein
MAILPIDPMAGPSARRVAIRKPAAGYLLAMKRFARYALPMLVLFAGACVPNFREPEVRLDEVRVGGLGFRGGTLYVHLVVANPNSFRLQGSTMRYTVEMNDQGSGGGRWMDLATGSVDRVLRVEANDSAVIEVPVDFTYSGLGSAIRSVLQTGELQYRLSGSMRVEQPIRRGVPFRHEGRVALAAGSQHPQEVVFPNGAH